MTPTMHSSSNSNIGDEEDLYEELVFQAEQVLINEPELCSLLHQTVLHESVRSFEDAVAQTVCYRLLLAPSEKSGCFCPIKLHSILRSSMDSDMLEMGNTMREAIRHDCLAVVRRDPAMKSILEVVLFSKGYASLVCHRAAYRIYQDKRFTALFLQSQCSAVFGVDLHPLSRIGKSVMFDHSTGIVVGETATIGNGCTLLHGVTLGGTGKQSGDRHPKVGRNVLIGANASILGNICIGENSKIGAGSVVLRPIPSFATAVGAPAKIIGRVVESKAGSEIDETLENVSLLHKSKSIALLHKSPSSITISTNTDDESSTDNISNPDSVCPYRMYGVIAKSAPKNSITICVLYKLLEPFGCTMNEIGACLFELDTKNVGYIYRDALERDGVEAIVRNTRLDRSEVETIIRTFLRTGKPMPKCGIGMPVDI